MEPSAPNREKAARPGGFFLLLNEFSLKACSSTLS
jgi:hypothetical protein